MEAPSSPGHAAAADAPAISNSESSTFPAGGLPQQANAPDTNDQVSCDAMMRLFHQQQQMMATQQNAFLMALTQLTSNTQSKAAESESGPPPPKRRKEAAYVSSDEGEIPDEHDKFDSLIISEESHSEDEPDPSPLLSDMAQYFALEEECGPSVIAKLAEAVNAGLRKVVPDDKVREIADKLKRPQNCDALTVPKVNQELWPKLKRPTRNRDLKLQKTQGLLIKASIPLITLMDANINDKSSEGKARLQMAMDAFRLLATAVAQLSFRRREFIAPDLYGSYKMLTSPNYPVTQWLFGDDLAKAAKEIRDTQRVASNVTMPGSSGYFSSPRSRNHGPPVHSNGNRGKHGPGFVNKSTRKGFFPRPPPHHNYKKGGEGNNRN